MHIANSLLTFFYANIAEAICRTYLTYMCLGVGVQIIHTC